MIPSTLPAKRRISSSRLAACSIRIQGNWLNRPLVYPDRDEAFANGMSMKQLEEAIDQNRIELNKTLPAFSQITKAKLYPEEFEKTAKKSIKRFLYQNIDE